MTTLVATKTKTKNAKKNKKQCFKTTKKT